MTPGPSKESNCRIGYEISLTRRFYNDVPRQPLEEIEAQIAELKIVIVLLLPEVVG